MSLLKSLNYQHVMSRMEWFRDLKLIFNKLLTEEDVLTPVSKMLLIRELTARASKLDLKSPEEYFTKSKVQAFSLAEIFAHIDSLEAAFNFDQLIDSLIYLSINKRKKEKQIEATSQEPTEKVHKIVISADLSSAKTLTPSFKEKRNSPPLMYTGKKEVAKGKTETLLKNPCLDLNFPENPLDYPEIKHYEKLMYLYLAGNHISHSNFPFPQTLIALNLSCNRICELKFVHEMLNLNILNVSSNQISRIFSINQIKNIKELFIGNNCIENVNLFCHLGELRLLDCSHNEIESFEDIAGLVISKRLGILKLKGNPIAAKEGYEKVVQTILPRIYNFDPTNLIDYSNFTSLGPSVFAPIRKNEETEEPVIEKNRLIINKSAKCITPTYKVNTSDSSPICMPKSQKYTVSKTPVAGKKPESMRRSNSQLRIENSKVLTNTTRTSVYSSEEIGNELFVGSSMIDIAERRIKVYKEEGKARHNVSIVSNESIQDVKRKMYGNPVAAMMIGPPAVGQSKVRVAKTPCFSVDLSRNRKK